MKYASRTRLRRSASLAPPPQLPSLARLPSRTRRALWPVVPLFPGGANAGYGAAHGRTTHREPRHSLYVVAALLKGEVGTFFEIGAKEARGLLIEFRSRSGPLLRSQRFSPIGLVNVTFDRGEAP